jgi:hypothetical protein
MMRSFLLLVLWISIPAWAALRPAAGVLSIYLTISIKNSVITTQIVYPYDAALMGHSVYRYRYANSRPDTPLLSNTATAVSAASYDHVISILKLQYQSCKLNFSYFPRQSNTLTTHPHVTIITSPRGYV